MSETLGDEVFFGGGIEFVKYNKTKEPFYNQIKVAYAIKEWAISKFNIAVYPNTGCVDGVKGGGGDVIILAPAYNITNKDVMHIAMTVKDVINTYFSECVR